MSVLGQERTQAKHTTKKRPKNVCSLIEVKHLQLNFVNEKQNIAIDV